MSHKKGPVTVCGRIQYKDLTLYAVVDERDATVPKLELEFMKVDTLIPLIEKHIAFGASVMERGGKKFLRVTNDFIKSNLIVENMTFAEFKKGPYAEWVKETGYNKGGLAWLRIYYSRDKKARARTGHKFEDLGDWMKAVKLVGEPQYVEYILSGTPKSEWLKLLKRWCLTNKDYRAYRVAYGDIKDTTYSILHCVWYICHCKGSNQQGYRFQHDFKVSYLTMSRHIDKKISDKIEANGGEKG